MNNSNELIGLLIKQRRKSLSLSLLKLSKESGVSLGHLARIERGGRFPSALVLRKIAKPLDFDERELMTLAGYLPRMSKEQNALEGKTSERKLDPSVAQILSSEPLEVQRILTVVLSLLRCLARYNTKT